MRRERIWKLRDLNELKLLYEAGWPVLEIALKLKRTESAVKTRAQKNGYRRPGRIGQDGIETLQAAAIHRGLDQAILPKNPTALRILIGLADHDILTSKALEEECKIQSSSRNKSIALLQSAGLVFVDRFVNPNEVVLTRLAYSSRAEPDLGDFGQICAGVLPGMSKLGSELDTWLSAVCRNEGSVETYRGFLVRQFQNAESGDITSSDFYSIFYSLCPKPDMSALNSA